MDVDGAAYSYLTEGEGLAQLVQLGVLEVHLWGARAADAAQVDTLVFDLDPGEGVSGEQIVAAARTVRAVLRSVGLTSWPKATGGKGLHVVVPGVEGCSWAVAKAFARMVADYVVAQDPASFTATMGPRARRGKIFVDYLRNAQGATAIAVYSPRARPGLPLARPLRWSALGPATLASAWTVPRMLQALAQGYSDPWRACRTLRQPLGAQLVQEALKYASPAKSGRRRR